MSIADELVTRGWYQGDWFSADGRVCLMGAACAAFNINPLEDTIPTEILRAVNTASGLGYYDALFAVYDVGRWNDDQDRTYDEVLRAAKLADEILDAR